MEDTKNISKILIDLNDCFNVFNKDIEKFMEKGNSAAGGRMRKCLLLIDKHCKTLRKLILSRSKNIKNDRKTKRSTNVGIPVKKEEKSVTVDTPVKKVVKSVTVDTPPKKEEKLISVGTPVKKASDPNDS